MWGEETAYAATPSPRPTARVHKNKIRTFCRQVNREWPMSCNSGPEPQPETDPLEQSVNDALAACDGDARATIRALIVANERRRSAS